MKANIKTGMKIIGTILVSFLFLCPAIFTTGKTVSDTVALSPLEEYVVSFKLHDGDPLIISITVTGGSIDLLIYDSENYISEYYVEEFYYDISTSLNTEFDAPWTDTFYLVFYNPDNFNSASFSFTLEHEQEFSSNLYINLGVGAGLLGSIIVLNFVGKKEENVE